MVKSSTVRADRPSLYYSVVIVRYGLVLIPVGFLEQVYSDLLFSIVDEKRFDTVRNLLAFHLTTEFDRALVDMQDCWFPYYWETGDLFLLPAGRGALKRSRGPHGMYLPIFEEITSVPVVPWEVIIELASISFCRLLLDLFNFAHSKYRQEATGSSGMMVVQSPLVTKKFEIGEFTA